MRKTYFFNHEENIWINTWLLRIGDSWEFDHLHPSLDFNVIIKIDSNATWCKKSEHNPKYYQDMACMGLNPSPAGSSPNLCTSLPPSEHDSVGNKSCFRNQHVEWMHFSILAMTLRVNLWRTVLAMNETNHQFALPITHWTSRCSIEIEPVDS